MALLASTARNFYRNFSDLSDNIHAIDHLSKKRVLAVKLGHWPKGDEELASVGILTRVRHRQAAYTIMFKGARDLIIETITGAAKARSGRIASLDHEPIDDAVKRGVVVEPFSFHDPSSFRIGPVFGAFRESNEVCD